ncbi:chitin binding peritrophin-A domain-containing protein [Pseudomonas cedrina]|uniref:chitin binding peritrophin-A domain-containing protein n=1 Tax=Pseudomonas cedrina TaxID=651740 RepID=UPI003ED9C244
MNLSRVSLKKSKLFKVGLGLFVAISINACTPKPIEPLELPCRVEGYFKSIDRVGGFYRCVWRDNIQRWIQYPFTCPTGLEFDEKVRACVRP